MTAKKIPLEQATESQLRAFAEQTLGISIHPNSKLETVRAKVKAAWDREDITVIEEPDDGPLPGEYQPEQPPSMNGEKREKVRIILQRTEDVGGDEPVPVGVNGRIMLVPRGEPVEIPREYFEVIKNAVTHRFENLPDGQGINPIPREVPLFPFQRLA